MLRDAQSFCMQDNNCIIGVLISADDSWSIAMASPSYSKNYETLMAVVTHLAVHKWVIRQPRGIAKDLSISHEDVANVLNDFKGLFRKSAGVSKDHNENFYALHLRFARQVVDEDGGNKEKPPLEIEYLFQLLEFISKKAGEEAQRGTAVTVALIAASISLVVSVITVVLTFLKH